MGAFRKGNAKGEIMANDEAEALNAIRMSVRLNCLCGHGDEAAHLKSGGPRYRASNSRIVPRIF
jgi:hypothetical protein